ncbi:MAG: YicC/YloC family endoribonuclease, partial [Parachlamydiaceae bacterium]
MLKSMTAYGRASLAVPLGQFSVEISSVNRRYLEVNNYVPAELLCFDTDIKKWIALRVSRGAVTVKLTARFEKEAILTAKPNLLLARQLKSAWEDIATDLGLPPERSFKLEMLADVDQIILYENNAYAESSLRGVLHQLIHNALENLIFMKEVEGAALWDDIERRLRDIQVAVNEIALLAPEAAKRYYAKFKERFEALFPENSENEDRLLRELCIYAEKVDISEEITRFKSHIEQFVAIANDASQMNVGKTLDFLIQEMNREINTVASKASELKIS